MINFNKNDLIDTTLSRYYDTFSQTLDTTDFVPEKYNTKIVKYIFRNLKRAFRKIDKEDKIYQREINKKLKIQEKIQKNAEKTPKKHKFLQFFKKIFKKNTNLKEN